MPETAKKRILIIYICFIIMCNISWYVTNIYKSLTTLTRMKTTKCYAVLIITVSLAAVSIWINESLDKVAHAQDQPTGFPPLVTQNATGNLTDANESAAGSNASAFQNLIIEHAGGEFTSLQTDNDNKTWIATGKWDLVSDPSGTDQSNSAVDFNATINMRGTDNSDDHEHTLSEFELTNKSIDSSNEGSTIMFNGTASIETDVGLYSDVPISIKLLDEAPAIVTIDAQTNEIKPQWIPRGGTISLLIDERIENHFGNTPVYGEVKRE